MLLNDLDLVLRIEKLRAHCQLIRASNSVTYYQLIDLLATFSIITLIKRA